MNIKEQDSLVNPLSATIQTPKRDILVYNSTKLDNSGWYDINNTVNPNNQVLEDKIDTFLSEFDIHLYDFVKRRLLEVSSTTMKKASTREAGYHVATLATVGQLQGLTSHHLLHLCNHTLHTSQQDELFAASQFYRSMYDEYKDHVRHIMHELTHKQETHVHVSKTRLASFIRVDPRYRNPNSNHIPIKQEEAEATYSALTGRIDTNFIELRKN